MSEKQNTSQSNLHQIDILAQKESQLRALETLLTKDIVTGLLNMQGLEEMLARECDRMQRGASHGGVCILIDLDNYGAIAELGSTCTNKSLRLLGLGIHSFIRVSDFAGRVSEDGFAIIMPDTSLASVSERTQRLTSMLNNMALYWQGHEIHLRVGATLRSFTRADTIESIFARMTSA